MFYMKKKRHGFVGGMVIGAVSALALGSALMMTNRTVRKEVSKELTKAKYACRDMLDYMR